MTRTITSYLVSLCLLFVAAPAFAQQQVGQSVLSDLNADGLVERFTLLDSGDGTVDLQIENTGWGVIYAEDIAWLGGIGQEPELSLAPNGSVRLTSMNESIGRNRWHMALTIAYRREAYRVAGFTYDWYDTLDPDSWGECDLNLLMGWGYLTIGETPRQPVRTDTVALPVTEWTETTEIPTACRIGD